MRFRLVVDDLNWPLLTGGRYSEVVVKTGLTVLKLQIFIQSSISFKIKLALNGVPKERSSMAKFTLRTRVKEATLRTPMEATDTSLQVG